MVTTMSNLRVEKCWSQGTAEASSRAPVYLNNVSAQCEAQPASVSIPRTSWRRIRHVCLPALGVASNSSVRLSRSSTTRRSFHGQHHQTNESIVPNGQMLVTRKTLNQPSKVQQPNSHCACREVVARHSAGALSIPSSLANEPLHLPRAAPERGHSPNQKRLRGARAASQTSGPTFFRSRPPEAARS